MRISDWSSTCALPIYVDDLPAAVKYLKSRNVRILGKIKTNNIKGHPTQGNSWVYVQAPWGTYFEFVSAPKGLGYESTTDKRLWCPRSSWPCSDGYRRCPGRHRGRSKSKIHMTFPTALPDRNQSLGSTNHIQK